MDNASFLICLLSCHICMVSLSATAIAEIRRLQARQAPSSAYVRLGIADQGCAGLSYALNFESAPQLADQVYSCGDVEIVVATESLPYLQGIMIDYSEDLMGGGFRFNNPNAVACCSCGLSFAVAPRSQSLKHPTATHNP